MSWMSVFSVNEMCFSMVFFICSGWMKISSDQNEGTKQTKADGVAGSIFAGMNELHRLK